MLGIALVAGCGGEDVETPATVFARQAQELAVGIEARREEGRIALETTVIAQDGTQRNGLDMEVAAGRGAWVEAGSCGDGRYCGTVEVPASERTIRVRLNRLDGSVWTTSAVLPVDPQTARAAELVAASERAVLDLASLVIHEHLGAGPPYEPLTTVFTYVAPDRLAYDIAGGGSAVTIGAYRWDRESATSKWRRSQQDPVEVPVLDWRQAEHPSLLGIGKRAGRDVWRVSFYDSTVPAWFEVDLDRQTNLPLHVWMVGAAHFMTHDYRAFNAPLDVLPPAGAT